MTERVDCYSDEEYENRLLEEEAMEMRHQREEQEREEYEHSLYGSLWFIAMQTSMEPDEIIKSIEEIREKENGN